MVLRASFVLDIAFVVVMATICNTFDDPLAVVPVIQNFPISMWTPLFLVTFTLFSLLAFVLTTAGEKDEDDSLQAISVQLNGQNYLYWSYVMKKFLKGQRLLGYVYGTSEKPEDNNDGKYASEIESWEANNAKIITWIHNSVTEDIGIQLAKYETAKEVWNHLKKLYEQSDFATQYHLEIEIRTLKQNDMTIKEYYNAMYVVWNLLALTESAELQGFKAYSDRREEQRLVQFLLGLRDEFEGIRRLTLDLNPRPTLPAVVNELLAKESRLKSRVSAKKITQLSLSSKHLAH